MDIQRSGNPEDIKPSGEAHVSSKLSAKKTGERFFNPGAQVTGHSDANASKARIHMPESADKPAIVKNADGTFTSAVEKNGIVEEVKLTASDLQNFQKRLENNGIRLQEKLMEESVRYFSVNNPTLRGAIGGAFMQASHDLAA